MHIETVGSIAGISDKSMGGYDTGGKNNSDSNKSIHLKRLGYTSIGFQ